MLILAIDTSTKACVVGLCKDGKMVAEYKVDMGMTHSEGLMPQLEQLFMRTGLKKEAVDLLAVSMGPGSFTGLRIGLATAEAMAYAWKKPLKAIGTPKALAYNFPIEGLLISPLLDAQKGNYYQALYEWKDGVLEELQEVKVVSAQEAMDNIAAYDKNAVVLGECAKLDKTLVPEKCFVAAEHMRFPNAYGVALAANNDFNPETDTQIFGLEPYYLRKSEAEELWEKRNAQK